MMFAIDILQLAYLCLQAEIFKLIENIEGKIWRRGGKNAEFAKYLLDAGEGNEPEYPAHSSSKAGSFS